MRFIAALCLVVFVSAPVAAFASDPIVAADHAAGPAASAPAAVPAAVPDPLESPVESASLLSKLYKSGAWVGLSILVAFFGLSIASKRVKWLKEGKRAVYSAAALGALAMLSVPASQGATPTIGMIAAAIGTAITLAMNPTKPGEPAKA